MENPKKYIEDDIVKMMECGTINFDDVVKKIKMKNYLKQHKFAIGLRKDGYFVTRVPDKTCKDGRRQIAKRTKEEVEDAVAQYYMQQEEKEKLTNAELITFRDMFIRYTVYKTEFNSSNTEQRYKTDNIRFFEGTDFESKLIKDIDGEDISIFLLNAIRKYSLSLQSLKNLKGYINGTFKYARMKKLITYNPVEDIEIDNLFKSCIDKEKTTEQRTASVDELMKLNTILATYRKKKPYYLASYAYQIAEITGMRVGEIVAITWDCVNNNVLIINKSERRNRDKNEIEKYEILLSTKGNKSGIKSREFPMTKGLKIIFDILREIQKEKGINSEYVFEDKNGRMHATAISDFANRISKSAKITTSVKSIHVIRRTVSSNLKAIKTSTGSVSNMLGQTEEINRDFYTYDTTSLQYRRRAVEKCCKKMKIS